MASNVENVSVTPGDLMEKIQALIASPVSEEGKVKKKEGLDLHPYYKRPGKGHNHDSCDSCKEGGNLLCCDKCPASFHLLCNNPPLDEKDIPMGQWICHSCQIKEIRAKVRDSEPKIKSEEDNSQPAITKVIKSIKSEETVNKPDFNERERRAKERAVKRLTSSSSSNTSPRIITQSRIKSAFDKLLRVGEGLNPVTFELPHELQVKLVVPGDDKVQNPGKVGGSRRSSSSRKKPYELDPQGLVPLPAKLCYVCKKSCAKAALIACDFCPLLFHLDCLDPPLTFAPTGIWMCPNHPQHYLEDTMWKGAGFSERVCLWQKYATVPVDEHRVKIDFLRKAYSRTYPRFRVNTNQTKTMLVPEYVKEMYKKPIGKGPSHRDLIKASVMYQREQAFVDKQERKKKVYLATPEEQELAVNTSLRFHLQALAHINKLKKEMKQVLKGQKPATSTQGPKEETVTKHKQEDAVNSVSINKVHDIELINGCLDASHEDTIRIYSKVDNSDQNRCPLKLLDDLSAIVGQELETLTNGEMDTSSELENWSDHELAMEDSGLKLLNNVQIKKSGSSHEGGIQNLSDDYTKKLNDVDCQNLNEGDTKNLNDVDSRNLNEDDTKKPNDVDGHKLNEDDTKNLNDVDGHNINEDDTKNINDVDSQNLNKDDTNNLNDVDSENLNDIEVRINHDEDVTNEEPSQNRIKEVPEEMDTENEGKEEESHWKEEDALNTNKEIAAEEEMDVEYVMEEDTKEQSSDESDYEEILKSMDPDVVKYLALKQLKQQLFEAANASVTNPPETMNGTASVPEQINTDHNDDDKDSEEMNPLLEVPQPILRTYPQQRHPSKRFIYKTHVAKNTKGLLVPVPTTTTGYVVALGSERLLIGTECDEAGGLCLRHYGDCKRLAEVHASISYNKEIKKYNLVNFSAYGTVVDNILYGYDVGQARTQEKPSRLGKHIEAIKKIRTKRQKIMDPVAPTNLGKTKETDASSLDRLAGSDVHCLCENPTNRALSMYEGPATLHHGSMIKFGCIEFTFAYLGVIESTSSSPPDSDKKIPTRKKQCRSNPS